MEVDIADTLLEKRPSETRHPWVVVASHKDLGGLPAVRGRGSVARKPIEHCDRPVVLGDPPRS